MPWKEKLFEFAKNVQSTTRSDSHSLLSFTDGQRFAINENRRGAVHCLKVWLMTSIVDCTD
jgi:hypothetical protein